MVGEDELLLCEGQVLPEHHSSPVTHSTPFRRTSVETFASSSPTTVDPKDVISKPFQNYPYRFTCDGSCESPSPILRSLTSSPIPTYPGLSPDPSPQKLSIRIPIKCWLDYCKQYQERLDKHLVLNEELEELELQKIVDEYNSSLALEQLLERQGSPVYHSRQSLSPERDPYALPYSQDSRYSPEPLVHVSARSPPFSDSFSDYFDLDALATPHLTQSARTKLLQILFFDIDVEDPRLLPPYTEGRPLNLLPHLRSSTLAQIPLETPLPTTGEPVNLFLVSRSYRKSSGHKLSDTQVEEYLASAIKASVSIEQHWKLRNERGFPSVAYLSLLDEHADLGASAQIFTPQNINRLITSFADIWAILSNNSTATPGAVPVPKPLVELERSSTELPPIPEGIHAVAVHFGWGSSFRGPSTTTLHL